MLDLTTQDAFMAERELCKRSFAFFVQRAWHVVEPSTQLKWGWMLDSLCWHLQSVTEGKIQHLLSNVPPGSMKSLIVGVFWPAWEWGPRDMPEKRFLGAAHEQELAIRDNRRCRDLIKSEWFQARWEIQLRADQDGKKDFGNSKTGFRNARAFASMTGARGDRVILDDPISAKNANSIAHLKDAETIFKETLPTRINDRETSSIVIIMQRLHQKDVSGIILDMGLPYVHFCVPMEYEIDSLFLTPLRPKGFDGPALDARRDPKTAKWHLVDSVAPPEVMDRLADQPVQKMFNHDPRTRDGELMFPERFGREAVETLKIQLGSYGAAGQLQQRPSPRGGGIIKELWWQWWKVTPRVLWRRMYVDTAQKEGEENDYSVLQCWGMTDTGQIALLDQLRDKWEAPDLDRNARQFWAKHRAVEGMGPLEVMRVEDKVSGTGLIQALKRPQKLPDGGVEPAMPVKAIPRNTDKVSRAHSAAPQIEAGNVLLPFDAPWITDYISEFNDFPAGAHDDQCDPTFDAIEDMLGGIVKQPAPVGAPEGAVGPSVIG